MCTAQYEAARRHFGKATQLDRRFVPAWIGFGHAFAAQDESDQVGRGGGFLALAMLRRRLPAAGLKSVGRARRTLNASSLYCPQAMAAYRTANRLFPGLHAPLLGMGMEYSRMSNLHLAEQMFLQVGGREGRV